MKQEIIDFYKRNKMPLPKVIWVGVNKRNLSSASIEVAAEALYDEIQNGREVRPIRLAWEIFSRAKILRAVADKKENDKIGELERKLEWYQKPWWQRIFRSLPNE